MLYRVFEVFWLMGTVIKLDFLFLLFFFFFFLCRINNKMFEKESYEVTDCWQVRKVAARPASAGGSHALCPSHEQSWCSSWGRQQPLWSPVWEQPWLSSEPIPGFTSHLPDTKKASEELFDSFWCQLFQIARWSPLSLVSLTPFSPPVILAKELYL